MAAAHPKPGPGGAYQLLEDDGPHVTEAQPVVVQPVRVVVVETVQRRKRSVCGGCCCCAMVALLICLLALFIPRDPAIHFGKFMLGQTSEANYAPVVDLKFKSRQPVVTKWSDLKVKLEWRWPVDDDTYELTEVAKFDEKGSFKTSAYGSKRVYPALQSINFGTTALLYSACLYDEVQLRLKGHVHNGDTKFAVETPWTWVSCD